MLGFPIRNTIIHFDRDFTHPALFSRSRRIAERLFLVVIILFEVEREHTKTYELKNGQNFFLLLVFSQKLPIH